MEFYKKLTENPEFYGDEEKKCIEEIVQNISQNNTTEERPGMLLGKIQSGKTKTFLGAIALAFDKGFSIAVILTKGTKVLCKQTVARVKNDFKIFIDNDELEVFDILDMIDLTKYELNKKLIIISKKTI